jgi:hypothetical protein
VLNREEVSHSGNFKIWSLSSVSAVVFGISALLKTKMMPMQKLTMTM